MLGLGDRHLSNLMLDQLTGEVVHIDFGDCFEVAIHRDKCPETVPATNGRPNEPTSSGCLASAR